MYFETGRCCYCGQFIPNSSNIQFQFCSDSCRTKATRPFLPSDFHERSLHKDRQYKKYNDGFNSALNATSPADQAEIQKITGKTLVQYLDWARQRRLEAEQAFQQQKINDENQALKQYVKKWQAQRDYILNKKRTEEQEKSDEQLQRQQQKETEEVRKEKEAQERREERDLKDWLRDQERSETEWEREQEKLQKEQNKLAAEAAEKAAYEESIAPRPVPETARLEHTVIVAGAGWGKTQLLQSIIAQDLQKPDPPSLIILDSTGAMVEAVQRLQIFNERLRDRILIIDPAHSPELNMFDFSGPRFKSYTADQRENVETDINALFTYVFSSGDSKNDLTGPQGTAFGYAIKLAMSRPNSNITDLRRLLEETPKSYELSIFREDIEKLDPDVQDFFRYHFFADSLKLTRSAIARRIHELLRIPAFRRMFTASLNRLDIFEEMNKGTCILVNTNVNLLKEDGMALFGRYVIARALGAAFERAAIPLNQRKPTYLIVDEAAPYFDDTFEKLFTRARQFKLATAMAFQHLEQAGDKLKSAIASSTRVKYAAGLGHRDRLRMAQDMETTPEFIASMKKDLNEPPQWAQFACYVRPDFPTACVQTVPFHELERMPKMSEAAHQQLLARNKQRLSPTHKPPEGGLRRIVDLPSDADNSVASPSKPPPAKLFDQSENSNTQGPPNTTQNSVAQTDQADPGEPSSDWKP